MSHLPELLARLKHVRSSGPNRYRAQCPAHGGDNIGTLAIKDDAGKILLTCHAHECSALDIVHSVGMEMADLFPQRLTHYASPQERLRWREDALHQEWKQEARIAAREVRIVYIAAQDTKNHKPLNETDMQRLGLAMTRIEAAEKKFNE